MRKERSYGIIALQKSSTFWNILLIQHTSSLHWAFPKGRPEVGEAPLDTAIRELKEETGLNVVKLLLNAPFTEEYRFFRKGVETHKQVDYYLAEVEGELEICPQEIVQASWQSFADAKHVLTYPESIRVLSTVESFLHT